jgi:hypothetical protein
MRSGHTLMGRKGTGHVYNDRPSHIHDRVYSPFLSGDRQNWSGDDIENWFPRSGGEDGERLEVSRFELGACPYYRMKIWIAHTIYTFILSPPPVAGSWGMRVLLVEGQAAVGEDWLPASDAVIEVAGDGGRRARSSQTLRLRHYHP